MAAPKVAAPKSWREGTMKEAWELVKERKLDQDLFEDVFQPTAKQLEELTNG